LLALDGVMTSFTYEAWGRMEKKNAPIGGTPRGMKFEWIEFWWLGGFVSV
jgi:hypothetical protein